MTAEPIAYQDLGAGPALLLVHGGFTDGRGCWRAQAASLADRARLLIVDRRGHGASPRAPRPYTIAGDATDLLRVADHAGLATFHLVGHSYGGLVAIEAARQAPDRVRSLHLIEPPYLALLADDPAVAPLLTQSRHIARNAAAWGPERTATAFFTLLLGPSATAQLQTRPAWAAIVREAARFADEEFAGCYPPAALADLRPDLPVQVFTGGQSHPGLRRLARQIAACLPGGSLVEVPAAGHAVQQAGALFDEALVSIVAASEAG